jgi:hypothetical protein
MAISEAEMTEYDDFCSVLGQRQGDILALIEDRAPVERVRMELQALKRLMPSPDELASGDVLAAMKAYAVRNTLFQMQFQTGEQRFAAKELIKGADKTSDAVDFDSWDYEDEDAAPPPSVVREQQKASRLAAFRKRGQ